MTRITRLLLPVFVCTAVSFASFAGANALADGDPAGATVTRELAWDGSESLVIDVPATVRFVQSAAPGKVLVTGPRRSVEEFSAAGGVLSDGRWRTGTTLAVEVHAPRIVHFSLKGRDKLVIEAFDQPELTIETTGHAEVVASGQAGRVHLQLQGIGWVDLSALKVQEAQVSVTGSRHALLAASEKAHVSGNGSVVLVGKPRALELDLGESGRVFTLAE